jgi:ABC-2 type transport system ATP-binding protein
MALEFPQYLFLSPSDNQVRVESTELVDIGPLVRFMEEQKVQVTEAKRRIPSLEDVFVRVTGIESELMWKEKEKAGGGGNQ